MSHYSDNPGDVRVDFFKESGKWYATVQVRMTEWKTEDALIHDSLVNALDRFEDGTPRFRGMQAVCLEPYHEASHPISLIWNGKAEYIKKQEETKRKIREQMK